MPDLIDTDAFGIAAYTYHGLAMRLTGTSLAARNADTPIDFDAILADATRMLKGEGAEEFGDEPDALRDRMLGGFRWLLVDEYQDINAGQYDFLSALAGRTLSDSSRKLTLMAVGDDDQNIYEFNGAQVEFIRRFETDYNAKTDYLVENFRSTRHIIDAANALIKPHPDRLKVDHPIAIDRDRRKNDAGGIWARKDSGVSQGRVQVLPVGTDPLGHTQAWLAIQELQRLAATAPHWDWSRVAIIASQWSVLNPMRAACELKGIPAHFAGGREKSFPAWRLREVSALMDCLRQRLTQAMTASELRTIANDLRGNALLTPGFRLIEQWCDSVMLESGAFDLPVSALLDDLYEYCSEQNRVAAEGITLTTAHGAKGLEFDHVIVLSGDWSHANQSLPAERRLYYVAMTRARETLTLCTDGQKDFASELANASNPAVFRRDAPIVQNCQLACRAATKRSA
ncbi:MAG: ATP-dependent helicase [Rhodocyclaceae bacterium]|nr:ATP-dependent helicase [Rhodocyclaceae bacterium]